MYIYIYSHVDLTGECDQSAEGQARRESIEGGPAGLETQQAQETVSAA